MIVSDHGGRSKAFDAEKYRVTLLVTGSGVLTLVDDSFRSGKLPSATWLLSAGVQVITCISLGTGFILPNRAEQTFLRIVFENMLVKESDD